jgi:DNA-binding transcriptional LysR family regulator
MPGKLNWSDVTVLLAFGRTGSLTASALDLGIDETTAARRMKRLETSLGVSLTTRDGGKLRLSDAGRAALERAHAMERAAAAFSGHSRATVEAASGRVAITALMYVFNQLVVPSLSTLLTAHPKIELMYGADNRNLSLTKFETDIALRMAAPTSGMVHARKLCDLAFALYRPRNRFAGLAPHRCDWVGPDEAFAHVPEVRWIEQNIPVSRFVLRSNSMSTYLSLVKAGAACAILPVCLGDHDRDVVRLQPEPVLQREIWMLTRADTPPESAIGCVASWLARLFQDIGPALAR